MKLKLIKLFTIDKTSMKLLRLFTAMCMIYVCDLKVFTNTHRLKILSVYHVRHNIQSEQ